MNTGFKIVSIGVIGTLGSLIGVKLYKENKRRNAENEIKQKEYQQQLQIFEADKDSFNKGYCDSVIAEVSLMNDKIKDAKIKSYAYTKLKQYKFKALSYDFKYIKSYEFHKQEFMDLYYSFKNMDTSALEAKIDNLMSFDAAEKENKEKEETLRAKEREHQMELEKLDRQHKNEMDIYDAKLKVEHAKLETICEAFKDTNKSVQSTLNIKTNIEE